MSQFSAPAEFSSAIHQGTCSPSLARLGQSAWALPRPGDKHRVRCFSFLSVPLAGAAALHTKPVASRPARCVFQRSRWWNPRVLILRPGSNWWPRPLAPPSIWLTATPVHVRDAWFNYTHTLYIRAGSIAPALNLLCLLPRSATHGITDPQIPAHIHRRQPPNGPVHQPSQSR